MSTATEQTEAFMIAEQFSPEVVTELAPLYHGLAPDQHLQGEYQFRYRAYGRGRFEAGSFNWEAGRDFIQGEDINDYAGGVRREFGGIPHAARPLIEQLISTAVSMIDGDALSVGVHMMRITADAENWGLPAPEGIHQDGFDYVMTAVIAQHNVSGGISTLLRDDEPYFQSELSPPDFVLFDDRAYFHYVSPVTPRLPGTAFRDALVFTFETIN